MKDFGFYNGGAAPVVLSDSVEICSDESDIKNEEFIVANSPKLKAQIYAPEIDFYIANTKDEPLAIAQNVDILYEARGLCFDGALDSDYEKQVGKNVILAGDAPDEELLALLKQHGFKVIALSRAEIKFVYGEIGDLSVSISGEDGEFEVQSDFFLVRGAQAYQLRQSGCYEISGLENDEILEILQSKSPIYRYRNSTIFDPAICQYHGRRNDLCATRVFAHRLYRLRRVRERLPQRRAEICQTAAKRLLRDRKALPGQNSASHRRGRNFIRSKRASSMRRAAARVFRSQADR